MMGGKKQLTLEGYVGFFEDPDLLSLSMNQLNEIVSMHGFIRFHSKKKTVEALKSSGLMNPMRSTLKDGAVYPCAPLTLEEVKEDIRSIGWEECPISSILAVGSAADSEENTSISSSSANLSCSTTTSATAAIATAQCKKRKKKKRARTTATKSPLPL